MAIAGTVYLMTETPRRGRPTIGGDLHTRIGHDLMARLNAYHQAADPDTDRAILIRSLLDQALTQREPYAGINNDRHGRVTTWLREELSHRHGQPPTPSEMEDQGAHGLWPMLGYLAAHLDAESRLHPYDIRRPITEQPDSAGVQGWQSAYDATVRAIAASDLW